MNIAPPKVKPVIPHCLYLNNNAATTVRHSGGFLIYSMHPQQQRRMERDFDLSGYRVTGPTPILTPVNPNLPHYLTVHIAKYIPLVIMCLIFFVNHQPNKKN